MTRAKAVLALMAILSTVSLANAAKSNADERATASVESGRCLLENGVIGAEWVVKDANLRSLTITDRLHGKKIGIATPFSLMLKDGWVFDAGDLNVVAGPERRERTPQTDASRMAERMSGVEIDTTLETVDHALQARWAVIVLDGSNYLRQEVTLTAAGKDVAIRRVQLVDVDAAGAQVSGSVAGSPLVAGDVFLGFEHPLSQSKVRGDRAMAWIDRELPLRAGQSITYSSVIGIARPGQMRRDFLAYLEQERAHPYRTFLHYNSWYDLGYFTPYDEEGAVSRVNAFGAALKQKRGVKLDSFLFDDGWDNHKSLWKFNGGFPHGFIPVKEAAEKYDARPGIWMSPWGGYSQPKRERIDFGRGSGYEIVDDGYALSGPKYYAAFRDVCLEMIRKYGVNQFKFDGTGNVDSVVKGSEFDSDFSAAIHLIGELRAAKPDIYINLTTGTWPSPFWLKTADSIWRGGEDDEATGVGSYRERWITYRDAQTYQNVVLGGPLYPLNSLMLHGMIYAQHHRYLNTDPGNDFRNEIRSYFGTGTQLQEIYITPALLSEANWDDLAEAARWSRANADVLKDTHWVGGDPEWLKVYGWASWSPRKGILVLRNPSDKAQTIELTLQDALELPEGAVQAFVGRSPWKSDADKAPIPLRARQAHTFELAPFEVLTLDLTPVESNDRGMGR
ncbi:MAG TPA: hypothetical protein VK716_04380 [Terracidiphilus sp.]|nr:hypothetical protein [Terracidiphilus sp.]